MWDSIKGIVSVMLSIPVSEVSVTPYWRRVEQEPAAVEIAAPLHALAQYQLPPERWAAIMQLIVAAGVRASVLLRGTFQFSSLSAESQYDAVEGVCRPRTDYRWQVRRLLRCSDARTAHKDEVR